MNNLKQFFLNNYILIIVFSTAFLIILGLLDEDRRNLKMLKNPKFTVGTVTSEWHSKSTFKTFGIDYKFSINDKEYLYQTRDNSVYLGEKYLVIYDSLNPKSLNRFLTNYLVQNYIKVPKNGWKYNEVPFDIDSNQIKNYIRNNYKNKVDK